MADSHLRDLYCIITGYYNFSIFKMVAVCHLGILKMKFFYSHALERHIPCHRGKFFYCRTF